MTKHCAANKFGKFHYKINHITDITDVGVLTVNQSHYNYVEPFLRAVFIKWQKLKSQK
jgi:hypothetical protein